MSEIGIGEVKENKSQVVDNFKNIKPEKEMTIKELKDSVKFEFDRSSEETKTEGQESIGFKEYFDDNGTKYREEDNLLPDTEFDVNGYKYKTDDKGRPVSAEGRLRIRDSGYTRNMEDVRKIDGQEYKPGDDRGHIIGHQFGGSDKLENLVPMDAKLNRGDFVKLENTLADAVKDSVDVRIKVELGYEGDSTRPDEFRVSYSIDGDKDVVVFRNESEAKS